MLKVQTVVMLSTVVGTCRAFKYFVWLNSSVRGPFLPAYHPAGVHWTTAFVRKLTGDVKLVGSTINCGGAYALSAQQPHVQSYAVAMDQVTWRSVYVLTSQSPARATCLQQQTPPAHEQSTQ
jgi:hypothetical protein